MKKILLIITALMATIGVWATPVSIISQGRQVTSSDGLMNNGIYVIRVNGGSYITESGSDYAAPNAQNSITDNALFTFIKNGDTWKVRNYTTGNYWGPLPGAATGNFHTDVSNETAGEWTFTFNGSNVNASSNGFYMNRSGGVMHGWSSAINLQIYNIEIVNRISEVSDLSNSKCYTVRTNDRGWWFAPNEATALTSTTKAGVATLASDEKQQFAFVYYNDEQDASNTGFYLYSVSAKKFVSKSGNHTTLTATPGDKVTLLASSGSTDFPTVVALNGSNQMAISNGYNPAVITSWNDLSDSGNRVAICEAADFDATDALSAISEYFHPSYTVTYIVKDGNDNVLFTSAPIPVSNGASITTLPAEYQIPNFYTYNTVDVTITATGNTDVVFTATPKAEPLVKYTADASNPYYYNLNIRSKYLVYNSTATGEVTLQEQSEPFNADASWAFIGEPYAGFKVINKTKGTDYFLTYTSVVTGGNSGNNNIQFVASDESENRYWVIDKNKGGFVLRMKENTNIYFHHQNSANNGFLRTCSVSEWSAVHDDAGSTIVASTDEDVLISLYNSMKEYSFGTAIGQYNTIDKALATNEQAANAITEVGKAIAESRTSEYANYYIALNLLSHNLSLVTPTAGYYRLKNVATGKYLTSLKTTGYASTEKAVFANGDATSAATVIELVEKEDGKLYMYNQSHGFGWVIAGGEVGSGLAYVTNSPDKYVNWFGGKEAGQVAFAICYGNGTGNYASYLKKGIFTAAEDESVIGGTDNNADAAQWIVEEATSFDVTISDAGYATMYVPFDVTLPEGITAYTGTIIKNMLSMSEVADGIVPAATPVVLKAEPATYQLTIGVVEEPEGNNLKVYQTQVDGGKALVRRRADETIADNALKGTFEPIDAVGKYVLAKPEGKDVCFYQAESGQIAPGKAYLELNAEVKEFFMDFDGNATAIDNVSVNGNLNSSEVYDLSGRRVNAQLKKGIYIINGKKVMK